MNWKMTAIYAVCGMLGLLLCMGARRSKRTAGMITGAVAVALISGILQHLLSQEASVMANRIKWGTLVLLAGCLSGCILQAGIRRRKFGKKERKGQKKKESGRFARRGFAICLVFICLFSGFGAFSVSFAGGQAQLDEAIATPLQTRKKAVNVLICGIDNDSRDAYHTQNMTDVMILANLDFEGGKATLLQIPRDTYVGDVTSTGKLNAVYNKESSDSEGINALAHQLNRMFALPVDHYVTITMEGFRKAVDAVGGIEVELESEMVFHLRDENEVVVNTVTLPAGRTTLDGTMADLFVRYRDYVRADLDRLNVQRIFIAAVMKKVQQMSVWELLSALKEVYPYLRTDYSIAGLANTLLKSKDFSSDSVTAIRIPGEPAMVRGQSVFSVHLDALADTLNTYMRPYSEPCSVSDLGAIELQNTTSILDRSEASLSDYGNG